MKLPVWTITEGVLVAIVIFMMISAWKLTDPLSIAILIAVVAPVTRYILPGGLKG